MSLSDIFSLETYEIAKTLLTQVNYKVEEIAVIVDRSIPDIRIAASFSGEF